jgi:hypothetical protein
MFFFYYLQTIRYNEPLTDAPEALAISRVSMTASPVAFSYWLERNWDHTTPTLGANTFNSLARIIRGDRMKVALDSLGWDGFDVLLEGKLFSPNVYTGFRQIIEDTTVPGSLLILFLCGVGVGIAYRKVHQGHGVWVPVLALFYFLVAGSYISLPVCFNSVLFAWGIIISATVGIRLRQRGRQRPPQTVPYAIATPLPTTKPVNV